MISRRTALGLLCAPAFGAGVKSWGWDQHGAKFELEDGSAEIQWISASSFRLLRRWPDSTLSSRLPFRQVEFTAADAGSHVLLTTKFITIRIHKSTFRIRVTAASDDHVLLEEVTAPRRSSDGTHLHFAAGPAEEFFGLGPRPDAAISARGMSVSTEYPLLVSSAGFGMYHGVPVRHEFDFRGAHRVTALRADRAEYCFYFGPSPKEILEEHKQVRPMRASGLYRYDVRKPGQLPREAVMLPRDDQPSWESLRNTVRAVIHAGMSGIQVPAFDLTPYEDAPAPLRTRAMQLAAVMPVVIASTAPAGLAAWRERLTPFFITYVQEAEDRGFPMLHPLPFQFPTDKEAPKQNDAFLLGDEVLVAPALTEATRRPVYLPMGLWTDLATNVEHRGRRVVEVDATGDAPPMLARNGSIVPFARPDGVMELHYFPNLGAEFFLFESELGESSQFHAGPAVDYLRLEIESKMSRNYEWVIHHRGPARKLEGQATARHDGERNNLHVAMEGPAGADRIVNILF